MISLSREVYDTLVSHARRGRPEEVCGILVGESGDPAFVTDTVLTENVAAESRTRYAIDPEEQLAVMEQIEAEGADVAGFYHSHPAGPDSPSETDAAEATWDGYPYVVVSLHGSYPYVGSWRWTGERFDPEAVILD
jgi:proteasome lid subunit RPN8/RPN11